jgi:hypothetical protein
MPAPARNHETDRVNESLWPTSTTYNSTAISCLLEWLLKSTQAVASGTFLPFGKSDGRQGRTGINHSSFAHDISCNRWEPEMIDTKLQLQP